MEVIYICEKCEDDLEAKAEILNGVLTIKVPLCKNCSDPDEVIESLIDKLRDMKKMEN